MVDNANMQNNSQSRGNISLCRTCALTTRCILIFSEEGEEMNLHSKIKYCCGVNVLRNDTYPKHICFGCIGKLSIYYEIKKKSENAQSFIHSTFSQNLPVDIDEPPAEIETIVLNDSIGSASTTSIHMSDYE